MKNLKPWWMVLVWFCLFRLVLFLGNKLNLRPYFGDTYTIALSILVTICCIFMFQETGFIKSLVKERGVRRKWSIIITCTIFAAGTNLSMHMIYLSKAIREWPEPRASVFIVLLTCLIGPVIEEVFCRGLIFGGFRKYMTIQTAILCTGIMFGVLHFPFIPRMVMASFVGCCWTWAYAKTEDFIVPVLIHIIHNCLTIFTPYILKFIVRSDQIQYGNTVILMLLSVACLGIGAKMIVAHQSSS